MTIPPVHEPEPFPPEPGPDPMSPHPNGPDPSGPTPPSPFPVPEPPGPLPVPDPGPPRCVRTPPETKLPADTTHRPVALAGRPRVEPAENRLSTGETSGLDCCRLSHP